MNKKTPSLRIIHSLEGGYCWSWIVRNILGYFFIHIEIYTVSLPFFFSTFIQQSVLKI